MPLLPADGVKLFMFAAVLSSSSHTMQLNVEYTGPGDTR